MPFLYKPDKTAQTVTEGGSVEFECKLLYGKGNSNTEWSWSKDEVQIIPDSRLEINSTNDLSTLKIKSVLDADKGNYKCTAKSNFGVHNEVIRLRVKGIKY